MQFWPKRWGRIPWWQGGFIVLLGLPLAVGAFGPILRWLRYLLGDSP